MDNQPTRVVHQIHGPFFHDHLSPQTTSLDPDRISVLDLPRGVSVSDIFDFLAAWFGGQ